MHDPSMYPSGKANQDTAAGQTRLGSHVRYHRTVPSPCHHRCHGNATGERWRGGTVQMGGLNRHPLKRMARAQPRFDLGGLGSGGTGCANIYIHIYERERERERERGGGPRPRPRPRRRRRREAEGDEEETASVPKRKQSQPSARKNPSMAAQIPRCPTTPPTRTCREPRPHGPQPQPPSPQHRRPAKGLQSDAAQWGGERGGPGKAWIRGDEPPLQYRSASGMCKYTYIHIHERDRERERGGGGGGRRRRRPWRRRRDEAEDEDEEETASVPK